MPDRDVDRPDLSDDVGRRLVPRRNGEDDGSDVAAGFSPRGRVMPDRDTRRLKPAATYTDAPDPSGENAPPCKVVFLPDRAEAWVQPGSTLLVAASQARVAIDAPCGDRGICGKCRVQLTQGNLEAPTLPERSLLSHEELAEGWRLACQARLSGDATVQVPVRTLKAAVVPLSQVEVRPNIRKYCLTLPEPTIQHPVPDTARLRAALVDRVPGLRLPLGPIRQLAEALSSSQQVTAVVAGESLIAVEPGDTTARCYGIAVDLGTTSVVVALADLTTGQVIGIESLLNGQANFGADVISRIHAAMDGGLEALQAAAVDTINSALASLLQNAGIEARDVYEAVVVGNSCMNHLFLGIDPSSLSTAPYQPVVSDPVTCLAADLGLAINPYGMAYTLPNVAGFVGSDTVAVILATSLHQSDEIILALDLGTNGEVVLGNRHRMWACSTAAGPAFEGARISRGMRATSGAIERVWIEGDKVQLQVIGRTAPIGICGSGLLDAVAQMLKAGILDESGRMATPGEASEIPEALAARLETDEGAPAFRLGKKSNRSVALTQRDVRELQLAKGAIRAGISTLLEEAAMAEEEISEVLLAGAFGSYINPASARAIGLVPPVALERITAVGNAAGQGAIMALLSTEMREQATHIARAVAYAELAGRSGFMDHFMDSMPLA